MADVLLPDNITTMGGNAFDGNVHLSGVDNATARALPVANIPFYAVGDTDFALGYRAVSGVETLCLIDDRGSDTAPDLPDCVEYKHPKKSSAWDTRSDENRDRIMQRQALRSGTEWHGAALQIG